MKVLIFQMIWLNNESIRTTVLKSSTLNYTSCHCIIIYYGSVTMAALPRRVDPYFSKLLH